METKAWALEVLKTLAGIAVPYIALLKTRADLDRFAAAQRSKETGRPVESQMRHRWYHMRWFRLRRKPRRGQ